ncbi:hypothetical protein [Xanthomonas arboricola]|uniref:hypothetical protein n=1 Tax=Xanthomonas arboricola TaxID=56448 RepID=UPI000F8EE2DA|nr:hypothetical protein [Xanthomonas arboricola]
MFNDDAAVLEARAITERILTPLEFVKLDKDERDAVHSASIVAPRLGESGFGGVKVQYRRPRYEVF